jgi:hypothetical protein
MPPHEDEPDVFAKREGFTAEEIEIISKARSIVKEKGIDVSGLDESLSRHQNTWYVGYDPPGHRGPGGGGWAISFDSSSKFIRVVREQ